MVHRRPHPRIHKRKRTTTDTYRYASDPFYLAAQDWVLYRTNHNPFRPGTPQNVEYEAGFEHAQILDP